MIQKNRKSMWLALLLQGLFVAASHAESGLAQHPDIKRAAQLSEEWLNFQIAEKSVPAISVAVVHDQEILWGGGFGLADVEQRKPATLDTLYSGCSMAKAFTAISVMQLRDQGKFDLDDDIEILLPWLKIKDKDAADGPVTVRQLLAHSTGLPVDLSTPYWQTLEFPDKKAFKSKMASVEAIYPTASRENYSNVGIELAGALVSEVSGLSIEDYVKTHIFEPLGMADSSMSGPSADVGDALAKGYQGRGRGEHERLLPPYSVNGMPASTGLVSSARDMARFVSWQLRNINGGSEILRSSTQREMYQVNWYNSGSDQHRGLGFSILDLNGNLVIAKDGGCPGYNTIFALMPEYKFGVVILINTNDMDPGQVAQQFVGLFQPALQSAMSGGDVKADDKALQKYAGIYKTYHYENAVVVKGDQLQVMNLNESSPADSIRVLQHLEGDDFARLEKDGSFDSVVTFIENKIGQVVRMQEAGAYAERVADLK